MQKVIFISIFSLFTLGVFAQEFNKAEDSDPAAKKVLEAMRSKYESYKTLEATFSLLIEMPEQPSVTQKGKLIQQDEKYRLTLDDRTLVSDGQSVWLFLQKNREVQINDVEEDGESGTIGSPKDLLKAYEWDDHVFALVNEFSEKGRVIQQIEFKPLSRESDYSKIRLTIDKKTLEIVSIKSFGRDGSRYSLTLDSFTPNATVNPAAFTFSKSECPDCHFEDLRL